jgi:hypothetical protein
MTTEKAAEWITEREAAEMLSVSISLLRKWRLLGRGPEYRRFGTVIRYVRRGVTEWALSQPGGGDGVAEGCHA